MEERWVEIEDSAGAQRASILSGLTRLGGGDAEIALAGIDGDQLHLWDDPPRLVFVGNGGAPTFGGVSFTERVLSSGDRVLWRGRTLTFHLPGAQAAAITELTPGAKAQRSTRAETRSPGAGLSEVEERTWARVRAGLLVDAGLADRSTVDRHQKRVIDGEFSNDECAREILASAAKDDGGRRLLERSGRLMVGFLMASKNTRVRAAGRRAKRKTQGALAFVIAQGLALGVFTLIVGLILYFLRMRGVSLDEFLDRFTSGVD